MAAAAWPVCLAAPIGYEGLRERATCLSPPACRRRARGLAAASGRAQPGAAVAPAHRHSGGQDRRACRLQRRALLRRGAILGLGAGAGLWLLYQAAADRLAHW